MKKGIKGILSFLIAFVICLGVFTLIEGVNTVYAASSGTYDGVSWQITDDGELILGQAGTTQFFTNNSSRRYDGWPWTGNTSVKSVSFAGPVIAYGSINGIFLRLSNAITIDLKNFDTSRAVNTANMFNGCSSLKSVDLSTLDTTNSKIMHYMFNECSSLTELNISSLSTKNVTDMERMFNGCSKLQSLDVSNFDTSKVTIMRGLFSGCSGLTELNVNNFDTSNVTDMSSMFYKIPAVESLDLSSFDTSKVTDMSAMFWYSSGLKEINVAGWDTSNVINMANMFRSCGIEKIDCSSWNTAKVTNMNSMLGNACPVKSITFGPDFKFANLKDSAIPTPSGTIYTGKWISVTGDDNQYTTDQLYSHINSSTDTETWIWELRPCAVLSDDGTLYFIRPTADSIYTSGSTGTVTSISGGEFIGKIYAINETDTGINHPWMSVGSQVKKVQFVDEIKPRNMQEWFYGFTNCTEMDLSKLNTSETTNMNTMFYNCRKLSGLNLSNFDTSKVNNMTNMFTGCTQLKSVNLGEKFTFNGYGFVTTSNAALLPTPSGDQYTGKWIREDKAFGPYTPIELRYYYDESAMPGVWIWELAPTEYTILFEAGEGATGAMASVNAPSKEDFTLPKNQFVNFGYDFDHWIEGTDGNKSYTDTIPANTYQAGDTVTLTAVWKKRDTSVTMEDGSFTFDIKAGEKATFKDIPAGTSYHVYELTPDGWVLVQQENASGVIEAFEESAAVFWNQYQPGVTTVQFSGLKTLDGHPASEGVYTFELLENGKVIDTATTQDGGFIQFKAIEYDAVGDHTYIIREVNPDDDSIDYDMHEETVNVKVTDDGAGNLSSEVTYDDDGIKFENHTRPGILRITKNADVTEANKDDTFTFEITFSNENGMPISDNIYWYVEN